MDISVHPPRVRTLLSRLFTSGLRAVNPAKAMVRHVSRSRSILQIGEKRYDLRAYDRIMVVGAGKASAVMARALEEIVGSRLTGGLVAVKYGHAVPTRRIEVVEAGHPVPDRSGCRATARILDLVSGLGPRDLLLVLISGGASSLLVSPSGGVTLADKQRTTQLLLRSGASIQEMNTVRKHLSAVKGGRLAAATKARVACLALSDVVGDDLGSIGSGPTAPDPTTYRSARCILQQYHLWSRVPSRVRRHVLNGMRGSIPETPTSGSGVFRRVQNLIIGNNTAAVEAVAKAARRAGFHPLILSTTLTGEARTAATLFGTMAREILAFGRPLRRPACLVAGGELTVTVRGKGRGGRVQEFALAAALEIDGLDNVWLGGFGTDGTDGPTGVAGAVANGSTIGRAKQRGLDPLRALARNDSYGFFRKVGGHITTGPTGTNVGDLYLLLVL